MSSDKKKRRPTTHSAPTQDLFAAMDIDPNTFFSPRAPRGRDHRKAYQLCAQVADTLMMVMSGECDDEIVSSLQLLHVAPAPDTSQLLVLVGPGVGGENLSPELVLEHLRAVEGRLRAAIASAITRRRTPRLHFQYVPSAVRHERPSDE